MLKTLGATVGNLDARANSLMGLCTPLLLPIGAQGLFAHSLFMRWEALHPFCSVVIYFIIYCVDTVVGWIVTVLAADLRCCTNC